MKSVRKPLEDVRTAVCVYMYMLCCTMHASICTYNIYINVIMPTSSAPGPPLCHNRRIEPVSRAVRDNRCGTHPTTAPVGILLYIVITIRLVITCQQSRARGRRPVRNVSSTASDFRLPTTNVRGGPSNLQQQ